MKGLRAGAVYFLVVFAAGFALGTVRVLALVPWLGERTAELLEMPVMVLVSWLAARRVVTRFAGASRVTIGLAGLALLLAAEFGMVLWLRGETVAGYVAGRDAVAGSAYAVSLLLFAAMPMLVRRGSP